VERRLAAILAADVVGYSRLMGADEAGTRDAVRSCFQEQLEPLVTRHKGRIVKQMGDGILAEFASAVNAVTAAAAIQEAVEQQSRQVAEERQIRLRVGVSLGDVMVEDGDIFGEGVNLAARLESLAKPGTVCLSGTLYDQVRNKTDFGFEDLGLCKLKNIAEAVQVFRLVPGGQEKATSVQKFEKLIGLDFSVPDYPSIAVLPFTVMSSDPEQEFFADGVTEDIITALSKISRLLVVARNSTFTYKGTAADVLRLEPNFSIKAYAAGLSYRIPSDRERIKEGLRLAGLPE
jgi:adenylate cyclase